MDEFPPDDVLARRAGRDGDAFAALYRRHLHRVYSYLMSRVGDAQDAQDLTAKTFLAALEGIDAYQPRGTFSAWLLTIARHKAADHFRHSKPLLSMDVMEEMEPLAAWSLDDMTIEADVISRLQIETVVALLDRLTPDRAEAVRLRYFGDLPFREVAVLMDKSESAVKMLVARGLDDIRNLLPIEEETR